MWTETGASLQDTHHHWERWTGVEDRDRYVPAGHSPSLGQMDRGRGQRQGHPCRTLTITGRDGQVERGQRQGHPCRTLTIVGRDGRVERREDGVEESRGTGGVLGHGHPCLALGLDTCSTTTITDPYTFAMHMLTALHTVATSFFPKLSNKKPLSLSETGCSLKLCSIL